jgi:pyruvate formate lyase activating enzyme
MAFLRSRTKFLDGVVISGGEPTLVDDLPEFILKLKELGYRVKLDTNGGRPEVLKDLMERNLLDYVALDLKADPQNYPKEIAPAELGQNVIKTLKLLKSSSLPHEFRTTCVAPFVDASSIEQIASAAQGEAPLYLQEVRLDKVFNPKFMANHPRQPDKAAIRRFRSIAMRYLPCVIR